MTEAFICDYIRTPMYRIADGWISITVVREHGYSEVEIEAMRTK